MGSPSVQGWTPGLRGRRGFGSLDREVDPLARLVVRRKIADEDVVAGLERERQSLRLAGLERGNAGHEPGLDRLRAPELELRRRRARLQDDELVAQVPDVLGDEGDLPRLRGLRNGYEAPLLLAHGDLGGGAAAERDACPQRGKDDGRGDRTSPLHLWSLSTRECAA